MITFKQLASGAPPDIEVTTDDANAEMAQLDELFHGEFDEFTATTHLDAADRGEDGNFVFTIPGDEAGEISDFFTPLADFIEECNEKAIANAESTAESMGG